MTHEERLQLWLEKNGLRLPSPPEPKGIYRPVVQTSTWLWTSGHLPVTDTGELIRGTVGADMTEDKGREAAVWAGLGILASVRSYLGSLDKVKRLIKLTGLVQSAPGFHGQPSVINGCSQLFAEVFGNDGGIGVRTAFGTPTLPLGAAVEIEAVFELADSQ